MSNQSHFTPAEVIIIGALLLLAVGLILPVVKQQREVSNQSVCGANLNGLIKAMTIYNVGCGDEYPQYDSSGRAGRAVGFREGTRRTTGGAVVTDNVTAVLWLMIRDGSMGPKSFVCPSTYDRQDPLTTDGTENGPPASLDDTYDFYAPAHLSYSVVNLYSTNVDWSTSVPSDYVIVGDNNNNDWRGTPARHSLQDGAAQNDVQNAENSTNHGGAGQNLLFGDSHVAWVTDPFQAREMDNVYAMWINGVNVPPTFGHADLERNDDDPPHDVALLPLSGNGGGAGSLDPTD